MSLLLTSSVLAVSQPDKCRAAVQAQLFAVTPEMQRAANEAVDEVWVPLEDTPIVDLFGLTMTDAYLQNLTRMESLRAEAEPWQILLEELNQNLSSTALPEVLARLAVMYDQATTRETKKLIMGQIMGRFNIPEEQHFLALIASGPYSKEFKQVLSAALYKIFIFDATWIRPLIAAKQAAGID